MNFAVTYEYIGDVKIKYPMLREVKKVHAFVPDPEYKQLVDNITDDLTKKRVIFAKNTGLRPAELTYLTWDDVIFDHKIVIIQGKDNWKPKTEEERIVQLNNTAYNVLLELAKTKKSRWVFSGTDKPVKSIRRSLATASSRIGVKKVTPNMLRHTFATQTLLRGGDIISLKGLMGHTDIKTTEGYLHAIAEYQRKTVELLDE